VAEALTSSMIDSDQKFNRVFGCGYPSDPLAKKWLVNCYDPVYGFPTIVRFSWSTSRKMLQTDGQRDKAYWFDIADEEKKNGGNAKAKGKA